MESLNRGKEYTELMIQFANALPGDNSYLIANLGYILEDINESIENENKRNIKEAQFKQ